MCKKINEKLNEGELFGEINWGDGRVFSNAKSGDEFEGPKSVAGASRARPADENVGKLWIPGKHEAKCYKDALEEMEEGILDADFASSQEVAAEGWDVGTDDECGAGKRETGS